MRAHALRASHRLVSFEAALTTIAAAAERLNPPSEK
jgi:hypothetical protein